MHSLQLFTVEVIVMYNSHSLSRLILIAEKDKVYDKFPIPLINRLEKHLVNISTILLTDQQKALNTLKQWIGGFTRVQGYATCCISVSCMCMKHAFVYEFLTFWRALCSLDSKKVMLSLAFSHKLQPLWFCKPVSFLMEHHILGMLM